MRTEDLIAELTARAAPVRPLPPPVLRALGWLGVATASGVVGIVLFGPRPDVMLRLTQLDYLWTALLALMTTVFAVVVTLILAIPGAERTPWPRLSTLGVLAVWAVTMGWGVVSAGQGLGISTDPHWPACFARVILVGLIPGPTLVVMVRRGIPLRLGWTAAYAALAAAAVGALAVQLTCPLDDAGHAFLGHFVPVVAMAVVGVATRRRL
jgi:hypothetical protein